VSGSPSSTQREFGQRYSSCTSCDLRVVADDGVSGTVSFESVPKARVLGSGPQGKFDHCSSSARSLGRETRLILNCVAELEKFGVRFAV